MSLGVQSLLNKVFDAVTNRLKVTAELSGSILQEQKTEADAVDGVVTFAENISYIEIVNTDTTNDGVFTVNGFVISVPHSVKDASGNYTFLSVWGGGIGGTVAKTVTITGAMSYILHRYA